MDMSYFDKENKGYRIALSGLKIVFRVLVLVCAVIAIIFVAQKIYDLGYEAFSVRPVAESESEGRDVTVVITKKMTLREIGALLNDKGLIDESEEAFLLQAYTYGYANAIIPGPYVLNTSMTVEEMLSILSTPEEEEEDDL